MVPIDGEGHGPASRSTMAPVPSLTPGELGRFITTTEDMIEPREVAALFGRAEMLARLPMPVQRWIVDHAKGDDDMGFIVEPYCTFLSYEVVDEAAATRLLPPGYRLIPTSMFADGEPRVCAILGVFDVRASVFAGIRVELYLIAESETTGMLTWVICDYESNTINYDPGQGFSAPTTSRAILTTTHAGDVRIDVRSKERDNVVTCAVSLDEAQFHPLDQRLWIEGNLSVDYGGRLAHEGSEPFGLIFDPGEMARALRLPLDAVAVERNSFGAEFLADAPFEAACFPYAQHFVTSTYPRATPIHDEEAVAEAARRYAEGESR